MFFFILITIYMKLIKFNQQHNIANRSIFINPVYILRYDTNVKYKMRYCMCPTIKIGCFRIIRVPSLLEKGVKDIFMTF